MNKTKVAVAVVVGLGIIWTGSAWYTGKQAEQHIDEVIAQLNHQLAENYPNAGLVISLNGYQRHIFSSETQLVVKSTLPADNEDALLSPSDQVVFNEKISHGPFPLAQIKRANFIPSLASIHTELANTPTVKTLFESSKGDSPFTAETRIGYNKSTDSNIEIKPLNYQTEDSGITSEAAEISIQTKPDNSAIALKTTTGNIALNFKNETDGEAKIDINKLSLQSDSQLTKEGLRIGTQSINLGNFSYAMDQTALLQLQNLSGKSNMDSKNDQLDGNLDYQIGGITWHKMPLGSASLKMSMRGFDTLGMKAFYDNYNQAVQSNMANISKVNNPDELQAMQNQVNAALLQNIPNMLKGAPHFSIDDFALKNDKGESHFSLKVDFNDPNTAKPQSNGLAGIVDSYVKQLTANLTVNKPMATELLTKIAQSQGVPEQQAGQFSQQQVESLATMGEMYRLTTSKDNTIGSSLNYTQGNISINDNKMSLEQFVEQYLSSDNTE